MSIYQQVGHIRCFPILFCSKGGTILTLQMQEGIKFPIIGLVNVFEVVNIRRGPKNGLTPECEARVRSTRVLTILRVYANVNDRENVTKRYLCIK